jgi:hypothetical protein
MTNHRGVHYVTMPHVGPLQRQLLASKEASGLTLIQSRPIAVSQIALSAIPVPARLSRLFGKRYVGRLRLGTWRN